MGDCRLWIAGWQLRITDWRFPIALLVVAVWSLAAFAQTSENDPVKRGHYVIALAGGCGCHTAEGGPTNAGGRPLKTPFGTFYGTNITPDPTHGIGKWT